MALEPDDFNRIQANLLELKNQNYVLEDQCKKSRNALAEAQIKVTVLEQELGKANKAIQKSKKAAEVQAMMRDNEALQHKLHSQEEDFRVQNHTLMLELSKLVKANELLESQVSGSIASSPEKRPSLSGEGPGAAEDLGGAGQAFSNAELLSLLKDEQKKAGMLSKEVEALKRQISAAALLRSGSQEAVDTGRQSPKIELVRDGAVSFWKSSSSQSSIAPVDDLSLVSSSGDLDLPAAELLPQAGEDKEGLEYWKARCVSLHEEAEKAKQKLRRKQESLVQIQDEKEKQFVELSAKLEEIRSEKDLEIQEAKDKAQRLQVQLNHGHTAFAQFRDSKAVEMEELQSRLKSTSLQAGDAVNNKLVELEAALAAASTEKTELLAKSSELRAKVLRLSEQADRLAEANDSGAQRVRELESELEQVRSDLEKSNNVSDKRKCLLDEMAIDLQTKGDQAKSTIKGLEDDLEKAQANVKEAEFEAARLCVRLDEALEAAEKAKARLARLEEAIASQDAEVERLSERLRRDVEEAKESGAEEIRFLKTEHALAIRDLNMQLEIANVQRAEFEEGITVLKQEMRDLGEDRKIADKKGQALIKDLKRQLLVEKQHNDRLSERIKNLTIAEANAENNNPTRCASEENDKTSDSSWSVCSNGGNGGGAGGLDNATGLIMTPPSLASPLPCPDQMQDVGGLVVASSSFSDFVDVTASSPTDSRRNNHQWVSKENYSVLLAKISSIQEEKWALEQKVKMLENSASAMADDLVRKSNIILHYCMEGKNNVTVLPQAEEKSEKVNAAIKKVADFLKHPELRSMGGGSGPSSSSSASSSSEESQRELKQMQRMMEETLTKNMHLQNDLEHLSHEVVRLSKLSVARRNMEND